MKTIFLAICLSLAETLAVPLLTPHNMGNCSNEGEYNCISDTLWQRCASGQWSVAMSMIVGTSCYATFGTTPTFTSSPSAITPASIFAPLSLSQDPPPAINPSASETPSPSPIPSPPLDSASPLTFAAATQTSFAVISCPATSPVIAAAQSFSGPASNFPTASQWESFEAIWCLNLPALQINDDATDIASMQSATQSVATLTSGLIDSRVIFAVIMQESSGNVHVVSTNNGVENNGLMQSHDGVSYSASDPAGSILQMIKDGTLGTLNQPGGGDGLVQTVQQFGGLWQGIRAYNSGSVDLNNLSNGLGSTDSYCSDIANRLIGAKIG